MSHAHQAQQTKSKENQESPHALAAVKWLEDAGELRKEKPSQNRDIHMLLVNAKLLGKSRYEVIPWFIQGKSKGLQQPLKLTLGNEKCCNKSLRTARL